MNRGCKVESYSNKFCILKDFRSEQWGTNIWQLFISPSYIILHHVTNTTQNTTTSISLIPHWQKTVNLCAWTITKKTEWLPWIMQLFLIFHNFFEKPQKLQKSQFLLGTLLPPVTLGLINFSKYCDFSSFSQFLEKLQFFLDTLLPPVPLDLIIINFSKNCDFSNFSQFLEESQKLQKSQFLLDTLVPPVTLDLGTSHDLS